MNNLSTSRDRVPISVILPTYNRSDLLPEAIQSILDQSFDAFELIIVDDGSEDQSAARVAAFNDPRIRYFRQNHRGISAAMNQGLKLACGEFIARLDSDDIWLPEMLATQLAALDSKAVDVVYARAQGMDAAGRRINDFRGRPPRYKDDILASLLYGDMTCNITILARRQCFAHAGYYAEELKVNEDWHMWLRVARHCRFSFTDKVLAQYRYHQGNITGADSDDLVAHLDGRTDVLDLFYSLPDLPVSVMAMKSLAYSNVYLWSASCWRGLGEYRRALIMYRHALRMSDRRLYTFARILWSFGSGKISRLPGGKHLLKKIGKLGAE